MVHTSRLIHLHLEISQLTSSIYYSLCNIEKLLSDHFKKQKWTGNKKNPPICPMGEERKTVACWNTGYGDDFSPVH